MKIALRHGAHLVPTYMFGHNGMFNINKRFMSDFQHWVQMNLKISIPIFWGRWGTLTPLQTKMTVVVGKPITVPKPKQIGAEPSQECIDEYHQQYVNALHSVFEEHKEKAGYGHGTLEVLDASTKAK